MREYCEPQKRTRYECIPSATKIAGQGEGRETGVESQKIAGGQRPPRPGWEAPSLAANDALLIPPGRLRAWGKAPRKKL